MKLSKIWCIYCVAALLVFSTGCAELKTAGRDIGGGVKGAAKSIGHGTRDAVKSVGDGIKRKTQ